MNRRDVCRKCLDKNPDSTAINISISSKEVGLNYIAGMAQLEFNCPTCGNIWTCWFKKEPFEE